MSGGQAAAAQRRRVGRPATTTADAAHVGVPVAGTAAAAVPGAPVRCAGATAVAPHPAKGGGKGLGGEQVEGRQAVRELLIAGRRRVHELWLSTELVGRDGEPDDAVADIVALARVEPGAGRQRRARQARRHAPAARRRRA